MSVKFLGRFAVAALGLAALVATAAPANADDYTGTTYSKASGLASQQGRTPVVATVNGDSVELDDCIVVSWRQSSARDPLANGASRANEVLFNLNCNATLASPGKPGNSAATPQGRAAKEDNDNAEYIAEHSEECYKTDDALQYCQQICAKTGKCEV